MVPPDPPPLGRSLLAPARQPAPQRRQRAFGTATGRNPDVARRVREAREAASLLSRLVVTAGFGVATALCIAGGTTTAVLSPRWLGGVLLALGAFFGCSLFVRPWWRDDWSRCAACAAAISDYAASSKAIYDR